MSYPEGPSPGGFEGPSPGGFSDVPSQASSAKRGNMNTSFDGSMMNDSFLSQGEQPSQFFDNGSLPRLDQSSFPEGSPTGEEGEEGMPWELNGEKVDNADQITQRLEEKIKRNFKHFIEFFQLPTTRDDGLKRRKVDAEEDEEFGRKRFIEI